MAQHYININFHNIINDLFILCADKCDLYTRVNDSARNNLEPTRCRVNTPVTLESIPKRKL